MRVRRTSPVHPGEVLREEFLKPLGVSRCRLAKDIGLRPTRVSQILHGKAGVSADTALRLARYFRVSPEFWLNLQARHDLEVARDKAAGRIEKEVDVFAA